MVRIFFRIFLYLHFTLGCCMCAKILVLYPAATQSVKFAVMPTVEELANRGHQITVVSPFRSTLNHSNVHEIVLSNWAKEFEENYVEALATRQNQGVFALITLLLRARALQRVPYKEMMAHEEFKVILKERKMDLVIINAIYNEFCYPISDYLRAPFVLYNSRAPYTYQLAGLGNAKDYASIPFQWTPFNDEMSFFERLINILFSELFPIVYYAFIMQPTADLVKEDFPCSRSISELESEASLYITNSHPTTDWPRSLPPSVIPIQALHARPANPLPEPFRTFVSNKSDGFILFTLGTIIPVSSISKETLQIFFNVFAKLPQRIVWKWETEIPDNLSPNILMSKWLPQQDLIGHDKARLFISHCGMGGFRESIYHALPILCLPVQEDQFANSAKGAKQGHALVLDWADLDEDVLFCAINRLINDPSFKSNATKMSKLIRDELMPGKDVAAYWIEYVLRNGGAKHLQLASKDMPFYKDYLLDVALFLLTICVLFVGVFYILVKFLLSKCLYRRRRRLSGKRRIFDV